MSRYPFFEYLVVLMHAVSRFREFGLTRHERDFIPINEFGVYRCPFCPCTALLHLSFIPYSSDVLWLVLYHVPIGLLRWFFVAACGFCGLLVWCFLLAVIAKQLAKTDLSQLRDVAWCVVFLVFLLTKSCFVLVSFSGLTRT